MSWDSFLSGDDDGDDVDDGDTVIDDDSDDGFGDADGGLLASLLSDEHFKSCFKPTSLSP